MSNCIKENNRIWFKNMHGPRVGRGIRIFRSGRLNMTLPELAEKLEIESCDLERLEEGYEPDIDRNILVNIAQLVGIFKRGNGITDDILLSLFMDATEDSPPSIS